MHIAPSQALGDYFETYVERDMRQLRSDTRIYPVYDLEDMLNEIKDNQA